MNSVLWTVGEIHSFIYRAAFASLTKRHLRLHGLAGSLSVLLIKLTSVALVVLHLGLSPADAQVTPIQFGETLAGSIDQAAETDTFTFDGTAGDVVRVKVATTETSSLLYPYLQLHAPDATLLCYAYGNGRYNTIASCTLPTTGQYSITVYDNNGLDTGAYGIHLQRLNGPVGATALAFGEVISASTTLTAEIDAYTYDAVAGDVIQAWIVKTAGTLQPTVYQFHPDGSNRGSSTCTATQTGTTPCTRGGSEYAIHHQLFRDPVGT